MKRYVMSVIALCISIAVFCCSCVFFKQREFICNEEEVKTIQIVHLDEFVKDEYRFEYTVLTEVTEHSYLIGRLKTMKISVCWNDPDVLRTGLVVIRIEYLNGDCDLVYSSVQSKTRGDKILSGRLIFDKNQFDALISEYVTEQQ